MSYVYGRRFNNFHNNRNTINSNRNNNLLRATFNLYQPKTANMNNQHSYYSSINGIKRNSSKKKIEYN